MLRRLFKPIHNYWHTFHPAKPTVQPCIQDNTANMQLDTNALPRAFRVKHATELRRIIAKAQAHDVIIISKSGNYGEIRLRDKHYLTLQCAKHVTIEAYIHIGGHSHDICLEGLNLWHKQGSLDKYLITLGKHTQAVRIQGCTLSSIPHSFANTRSQQHDAHTHAWVNGISIQGEHHKICHNRIQHIYNAIYSKGFHCQISSNLIQFFSHYGIHIQQSLNNIKNNTLLDPLTNFAKTNKPCIAILLDSQLSTPLNTLSQLNISNNRINSRSVQRDEAMRHQKLLGVVARKALFERLSVQANHITIYNPCAIELHNAPDALITDNKIALTPQNAGISCLMEDKFTAEGMIKHGNNQAAFFTIAQGYKHFDLGNNDYKSDTKAEETLAAL